MLDIIHKSSITCQAKKSDLLYTMLFIEMNKRWSVKGET